MPNLIKNNKVLILSLAILAFLGVFGKSIYKEKQLEIKELKSVIIEKEKTIDFKQKELFETRVEYFKLEKELVKLRESKNIEIEEGINADGSSYKKTKIKTKKNISKEKDTNISIDQKNTKTSIKNIKSKDKESSKILDLKHSKEKTIEKVDSGLKPLVYLAGGVLICILTGVCGL